MTDPDIRIGGAAHHLADPDIWLEVANLICFQYGRPIARLFLCWRGLRLIYSIHFVRRLSFLQELINTKRSVTFYTSNMKINISDPSRNIN